MNYLLAAAVLAAIIGLLVLVFKFFFGMMHESFGPEQPAAKEPDDELFEDLNKLP